MPQSITNSKPRRRIGVSEPVELQSVAAHRVFGRRLLRWYDQNRRDLPWRKSRDPYGIWISEVMLQQTRVGAVLAYYQRFLQQFPSVQALAAATPDAVLAAWSGLGYYRRARSLHAAANMIVESYGGRFPGSAAELRKLPGFGPYTAAAVASIAFAEPVAVVDGNVERVLTRLFAWQEATRGRAWETAQQLLAPERPGDFNQALMEVGATICLPAAPECRRCPVLRWCRTRGRGAIKTKERRKEGRLHYRLTRRGDAILLVQRDTGVALMPGMWELPEIPVNSETSDASLTLRHSITVTDFTVEVSQGEAPAGIRGRWVRLTQVESLPLTGITKKILRRASFI